ncbi:MAG TPA: HipA family kinase [Solirubrobacteraceae bacterium]|jgi:hypothetical protein|nr:HipA family kinase [Solirubrobacteraceae bacterium]
MLRTVCATRYAAPLREGGSLPGLVEADDDGMYVVKFRAAGQGLKALVAEVLVGRLAQTLGLPVPELVTVEVSPQLGRTEPDAEINELVSSSAGLNFGIDFLPGALDYSPARPGDVEPDLASEVVWFDALTTNVDRTPRNPNLLLWHDHLWLIDHGAALYQHHGSSDLLPRAREGFPLIKEHVLLPRASALAAADERLPDRLDAEQIDAALADVPDEWLGEDPAAARRSYREYLLARLEPPRTFAEEAARAYAG